MLEQLDISVNKNDRTFEYGRGGERAYYAYPRVYVSPKGESIMENLMNRRSRPIKLFRAAAIAGLAQLGIQVESKDLKWSQYAGCNSCPCSPGFIYKGANKVAHYDVWVSITAKQAEMVV